MEINSITSSSTLALDTNIFIYAYTPNRPKHKDAVAILDRIRQLKIRTLISVIVFEEFLVGIYKQGLENRLSEFEDFLTASDLIKVVDVNRQIARTAAKLRAEHPSLRAPDAIHLASAIESKAKIFLTTDRRLPKKIGKLEIKVL